jgi:hypothetical protein
MFMPRGARSGVAICALTAALTLWASAATAVTKSFDIPLESVTVGVGFKAASSIALPATANSTAFFGFVLPRDYELNGPVNIVLYLQTSAAPCTVRLVPIQLVRRRVGAAIANSLSGVQATSPTIDFTQDTMVVAKVFTVGPGDVMRDQRRGDAIGFQVRREPGDATDTCDGIVFVHAIDIRYPSP